MENHKIRVLIPRFLYNDERVKLVEKFCPLKVVHRRNLRRCDVILEKPDKDQPILEGFLESKEKLRAVTVRLTDNPLIVPQGDIDMQTYLIDEGQLLDVGASYIDL